MSQNDPNAYFDAKLESISNIITGVRDTMNSRFNGLEERFARIERQMERSHDDYEARLRAAQEVDTEQGREITRLEARVCDLEGASAKHETMLAEQTKGQIDTWKKMAIKLAELAVMSGSAGGVIAAVLKAFGG